MDRRTLLYVLGLTLLFFLMNQWFNHGKDSGEDTLIKQPRTEILYKSDSKDARIIPPSEYENNQIERLYYDINLTEFAVLAYKTDDNYITFAWKEDLPNDLYLKPKPDTGGTVRRINLRFPPKDEFGPVLYSLFPLSKVRLPWVSNDGKSKVQLLFFDAEKAFEIDAVADGTEQLIADKVPTKNALAVMEVGGKFGPYAYLNSYLNRLEYFDHIPDFENYSVLASSRTASYEKEYPFQKFYVLENEYLQLVFSNINGALSEINLPFETEENQNSVVREIEPDRILFEDYPINDTFPLYPSYRPASGAEKMKLIEPVEGGYYPLLRRDSIGLAGDTSTRIDPHYYALNLFENDQVPDGVIYSVKRFEKDLIQLEATQGGRKITKTFSFPRPEEDAPYCLNVEIAIDGDARGLNLNLGIPEVELISGAFTPTLKYRVMRNQKSVVENIKPPKGLVSFNYIYPEWLCNGNGFFGIILDPLTRPGAGFAVHPVSGELVPSRLTIIDAQYNKYPPQKFPGYTMQLPVNPKSGVSKFRVFAGPFDKRILDRVDLTFTNTYTGGSPDYAAAQSYHGWFAFISQPFAKFLFILLDFFHDMTSSWGVSIIFLTIALRLMLYPLNTWSMKSSIRMQQIAPKVQAIQEKYKKDPKRVQLETMNLYRREGVNPFKGCLPTLIQLPFLFGMFDLLKSSFDLRGATFIPGWIDNLTAPDVVFSWSYPIPFIGNSFHLLPIILGVIMFFQQKMMSASKSQSTMTDEQKQMGSMMKFMPLLFTVLFYKFPSGLNIYWISSTLLGMLQQWWITKRMTAKGK